LNAGGRSLWVEVTGGRDLDAVQRVQLEEACRAKDRLDQLDALLRGDATSWCRLVYLARDDVYELRVDGALAQANSTANVLRQLLAGVRLSEEWSATRPQSRGVAPTAATDDRVSSLDRARRAKSG